MTIPAHGISGTLKVAPIIRDDRKVDTFIEVNERQLADLIMITSGGYSPLETFMDERDYISVIKEGRLSDSTLWPIPITFDVTFAPEVGEILGLTNAGRHLANLTVTQVFEPQTPIELLSTFGTDDPAHPGVAATLSRGSYLVTGPIALLAEPNIDVYGHYLTPVESRAIFKMSKWKSVVAFQTRNPIHRAHEYLHKVALELIDGLLIHPLVGATKDDDVPADVRMEAYRVLIDNYYPKDRVLLATYPAAMRYAGPKEALLHAISRQNYGCTHFIVGRDHAGVGNYYDTYAAQEAFDELSQDDLKIQIIKFEHSFFCKKCEGVVSKRSCPHHSDHHLVLSGTKVRQMLRDGTALPSQFTRAEVAKVLEEQYR
ncbi:MAG: sulfate adenylyltransferase [Actinomycetota bacterium]|nr:sulfate adenylyltransferase [Actinomycetota bacterium]